MKNHEPAKRILIVCNPTAGRYQPARLQAVTAALERLGARVRVVHTTRRGDAEELARTADPEGVDVVVAAGGDGTIGEVVTGLLGRGLPLGIIPLGIIPLGIIPLGTTNVLAAELDLPSDPQAIAACIVGGDRLRSHLGRANGRIFIMMAGLGFDARIVRDVSPFLKKFTGKGAYVWGTVCQLFQPNTTIFQVTMNGQIYRAASVIIGNGHFYAGRYICTPNARLENPVFQVCLFARGSAWANMVNVFAMLLGKVPVLSGVTLIETDRLTIEGTGGEPVQGDGDILTELPLVVEIAEETLDIITVKHT